jgi:hypothetical protein
VREFEAAAMSILNRPYFQNEEELTRESDTSGSEDAFVSSLRRLTVKGREQKPKRAKRT